MHLRLAFQKMHSVYFSDMTLILMSCNDLFVSLTFILICKSFIIKTITDYKAFRMKDFPVFSLYFLQLQSD